MHKTLLGLVFVACLTSGCGDDTGPLFFSIDYRLRCQFAGGCPGALQRNIMALNGETGEPRVGCNAVSMGETVRVDTSVSFQMGETAPYGIRLGNLVFRPDTGVQVGQADVIVTDDGNDYVGAGGPGGPVATCRDTAASAVCPEPCRITNLMVTGTDTGSTLSGSLYCEGLQLRLDPARERELTNSASPAEPAFFEIDNCEGF